MVVLSYIPAAPGFDVLVHLPDDRNFYARPVIAWVLMRDGGSVRASPVAVTEPKPVAEDRPVRLPNGEVICGELEWATTEKWLDDMNAGTTPQASERKPTILALDTFRSKMRGE